VEARVNPDRCVGCGICSGSCDPGAINLVQLPVQAARRQVDAWVDEATAAGEAPYIAFVCGYSVGESFPVDTATGQCAALPGYRVFPVPCAGWVQPRTVERAFKRGARGVLVVGCGPGECTYREGAKWTAQRLSGERRPALRPEMAPRERVRFLQFNPTEPQALVREAARFREGGEASSSGRALPVRVLGAAAVVLVSCGVMAAGSRVEYAGPPASTELVVSFKHPGRAGEDCRELSPEELEKLPVHMRQPRVCQRVRPSVRLRVRVDDAVVLERAYAPGGVAGDGNSIAIERLPVEPGRRVVSVELGETSDPKEWTYREERAVEFLPAERRVLLFDRLIGFTWHGGPS
jgi:coenzyme F420-reducing hydrogenase delta subunit